MIEDEIEVEVDSYVLNPDYDPDRPYTSRAERKEWAAVVCWVLSWCVMMELAR